MELNGYPLAETPRKIRLIWNDPILEILRWKPIINQFKVSRIKWIAIVPAGRWFIKILSSILNIHSKKDVKLGTLANDQITLLCNAITCNLIIRERIGLLLTKMWNCKLLRNSLGCNWWYKKNIYHKSCMIWISYILTNCSNNRQD